MHMGQKLAFLCKLVQLCMLVSTIPLAAMGSLEAFMQVQERARFTHLPPCIICTCTRQSEVNLYNILQTKFMCIFFHQMMISSICLLSSPCLQSSTHLLCSTTLGKSTHLLRATPLLSFTHLVSSTFVLRLRVIVPATQVFPQNVVQLATKTTKTTSEFRTSKFEQLASA